MAEFDYRQIAWSKTGSIARITTDGTRIAFRAVVRDSKSGIWSLSSESPEPVHAPENVVFTHIEWSGLGLDLVALDQTGMPHLYTLALALGRVQPCTTQFSDVQGDLGAFAGLHWLPIFPTQFKVGVHVNAVWYLTAYAVRAL